MGKTGKEENPGFAGLLFAAALTGLKAESKPLQNRKHFPTPFLTRTVRRWNRPGGPILFPVVKRAG